VKDGFSFFFHIPIYLSDKFFQKVFLWVRDINMTRLLRKSPMRHTDTIIVKYVAEYIVHNAIYLKFMDMKF